MRSIAVALPAWRRPYYLEPVLRSWAAACALMEPYRFMISLGNTDRRSQQLDVINKVRPLFKAELEVKDQSREAHGNPHRVIGEMGSYMFSDDNVDFVVLGEEDVKVSDDTLLYMKWAEGTFADARDVLTVCAHNKGGQEYDGPAPAADADADQRAARLLHYFNGWVCGTWFDRWEGLLEPTWCWQERGPSTGWDWTIQGHMQAGYKSVVPDASRSQNIGELEGRYATPATWAFSHSQSFREQRRCVEYKLEDS